VAGVKTLNEAFAEPAFRRDTVGGVPFMVSGLNNISNLMARIVSAQGGGACGGLRPANRHRHCKAQAQLGIHFHRQQAGSERYLLLCRDSNGLASQLALPQCKKSGAVNCPQFAKFGVSDQSVSKRSTGSFVNGGKNVSGFKNSSIRIGWPLQSDLRRRRVRISGGS